MAGGGAGKGWQVQSQGLDGKVNGSWEGERACALGSWPQGPASSSSGMQSVFTAPWIPVPLRKSFFPGLEETGGSSLLRTPLPQLERWGSRGRG